MNIESQVASLEVCMRLKELGVKQDSYFYWCLPKKEGNGGLPVRWGIADIIRIEKSFFYPQDKVSAFTVVELGEMLPPSRIVTLRYKNLSGWRSRDLYKYCPVFKALTETDARAEILIHLLENYLIEVEK